MRTPPTAQRPTIRDLTLFVAGVAVGLWLAPDVTNIAAAGEEEIAALVIFALGGLSVVGPPLLLWERYRRRRRFRLGELLWFIQGMASWLLWPPMVVKRVQGDSPTNSTAAVCYFYGTPLMALYIIISLFAGGWLLRRRRHVRSWRDAFGLALALAWACTGLYVPSLIYRRDLR